MQPPTLPPRRTNSIPVDYTTYSSLRKQSSSSKNVKELPAVPPPARRRSVDKDAARGEAEAIVAARQSSLNAEYEELQKDVRRMKM